MEKEELETIIELAKQNGRLQQQYAELLETHKITIEELKCLRIDYGIERINYDEVGSYEKAINRLVQQIEFLLDMGIRKELIFKDIAKEIRERNCED